MYAFNTSYVQSSVTGGRVNAEAGIRIATEMIAASTHRPRLPLDLRLRFLVQAQAQLPVAHTTRPAIHLHPAVAAARARHLRLYLAEQHGRALAQDVHLERALPVVHEHAPRAAAGTRAAA